MDAQNRAPAERLLTVREVKERLHIAESRVWLWVMDGTLPSVKLGNSRRILETDLNAFILGLRVEQVGGPVDTAARE